MLSGLLRAWVLYQIWQEYKKTMCIYFPEYYSKGKSDTIV